MSISEIQLFLQNKKYLLLLAGGIFCLLLIFLILILSKQEKKPKTELVKPPPASTLNSTYTVSPTSVVPQGAVVSIGNDLFSKEDLDYLISVFMPEKRTVTLTASDEAKLRDIAVERSAVIQEAKANNLVSVDEEILKPDKNWQEYNETYEKSKAAVITLEEQISVAGIFMYFQNMFPPPMGVERAKALTREKMEKLRENLLNGTMNLQQAGQAIREDISLIKIDSMYQQNAYAEFRNRNKTRPIVDGISASDNALIWSLNVGEYSPIILGYESGNAPQANEAYWGVFQVFEKKGTGKPYLEWLKEMKKKYDISTF